jgi:hypothetical protein
MDGISSCLWIIKINDAVCNYCIIKIKFKIMKKLSRNEMKNVMGGVLPDDGGANCSTSCTEKVRNTVYIGTCSKGTITVGGTTRQICTCSRAGGAGCVLS